MAAVMTRQTLTIEVVIPASLEEEPRYLVNGAILREVGRWMKEDANDYDRWEAAYGAGARVRVVDAEQATTDSPPLNVEELQRLVGWAAVEQAKKDAGLPSEWDQGAWVRQGTAVQGTDSWCGTACCIAGKAAIDAGALPVWRDESDEGTEPSWWLVDDQVLVNGEERSVSSFAGEVLGLNTDESSLLFDGSNTLTAVMDTARRIIAGEFRPQSEPAPAAAVVAETTPPPAEVSIYHIPTEPQDCPYGSIGCDCNVTPAERERRRVAALLQPAA